MSEMTRIRILLVEDDPITAREIQLNLTQLGYEVCCLATTGTEAIKQVEISQPDLVVMNIDLQGEMKGVETANYLYQELGIPVIFLATSWDQKTLQSAIQAKPFGYILKPFAQPTLAATIKIALTRYNAEKEMQQNLQEQQQLRQQAEELSEVRSRYLAIASHEFRTPLSSILFASTLLERCSQTWSEEKKQTYLQLITKSVKNMNQLIDDMLTVEQTGESQFSFQPALLDLVSFCKELVAQMQPLSPTLSPVNFQYEGEFSSVYVDAKLLRHILTNLLSNAIKYSSQGTPVIISLRRQHDRAIFEVRDRGIGIPPTDLEKLFQVFHRGKNVKSIAGTGLGLSIVKKCVELHGGYITVESIENKGTTFTVVLPLNTPQKAS